MQTHALNRISAPEAPKSESGTRPPSWQAWQAG